MRVQRRDEGHAGIGAEVVRQPPRQESADHRVEVGRARGGRGSALNGCDCLVGILRDQPNVKWTKDRGTDVQSAPWYPVHNGERINDHHTTLDEKRAARETSKRETKDKVAAE